MEKVRNQNIIAFIVEFTRKLGEMNEDLITDRQLLRFEKKEIWLCNIWDAICGHEAPKGDGYIKFFEDHYCFETDMDVKEFKNDDNCVACLLCEGILFETISGYWDHEDAKKLHAALYDTAQKYGFYCDEGWTDFRLYEQPDDEEE